MARGGGHTPESVEVLRPGDVGLVDVLSALADQAVVLISFFNCFKSTSSSLRFRREMGFARFFSIQLSLSQTESR